MLVVLLNVGSLAGEPASPSSRSTGSLDTRSLQYWDDGVPNPNVITYQDRQSCTLLVFDADGKRLRGVKVQDQSGRVLPMRNRDC